MKKIFLGVAALPLLALLATSCTNETIETNADTNGYISFKAVSGKQALGTRAGTSETVLTNLQTTGIKIKSFNVITNAKFGPNGIDDFDVMYDGVSANITNPSWMSEWYYANPLLHPAFGLKHYSFFSGTNTSDPAAILGLAPLDYTNAGTSITLPFNTKTANAATDLMAATGESKQGSNPTDATAPMFFKHLLSQVNFAIQGVENVKISVKDIKVNNILVEGEYILGNASVPLDYNAWITNSLNLDYFDYEIGGTHETTGAGIPSMGTTDDIIEYLGNGGGTNTSINALMLMPQDLLTSTGTITFDYKITDMYGNLLVADRDADPNDTDGFNSTSFNLKDITNIQQWNPGYRYLYILSFATPDYIKFNVAVDGWVDSLDGAVDTDDFTSTP